MQFEAVGAAQTVTGSKHIIRSKHATVLLDCGLYQGRRRESREINESLGVDPREIDAVVLSHAHIDHSGALPLLMKKRYDGPVFATPATRDLCAVMLEDAALIQVTDARYVNKTIEREGADMDPVEPLYEPKDVLRVLEAMISIPYRRRHLIAPGVHLTFLDAGHVLGSAVCVLEVEEHGVAKRVVFTGDLGRSNMPILADPEVARGAQVLITESTYGDRIHDPIEQMEDELEAVVNRVYARGGKIVIPSFALERAQELVYSLKKLKAAGKLPPIPVYVDSPLTVKITDIFKLHPECFDEEARDLVSGHASPFEFEDLRYVSDKEESKALDANGDPAIIISASGMCEAGRVVHHLKATIESPKNAVVIVGFMAPHTLGRRLVERRPRVRIFGLERDLRAEVVTLNGFSAHADQADLIDYARKVNADGALEKVILVHGEPKAQAVLGKKLEEAGCVRPIAPEPGDIIEL